MSCRRLRIAYTLCETSEGDVTVCDYYRARYYHPTLQRFLSEDPIRFMSGDSNFYAYVQNNPLNLVDPLGWQGMPTPGSTDAVAFQWAGEFGRGAWFMFKNWRDLGQYARGLRGGDKYYHCKANCQAAQTGLGGEAAAIVISYWKEVYDQRWKGWPASDSVADEAANIYGRACGVKNPKGLCGQLCEGAPGAPALY